MKIKSFFLLSILFFNCILIAQMRMIKGIVRDSKSSQGLMGVIIGFNSQGTSSDENGNFHLAIDSSVHYLTFRLIGYQDTSMYFQLDKELVVFMNETSYLLNTSVITSSRSEKPLAESSISMSVIKSDLPSKLNSNNVSTLLDRVPGVQIIDGQANIRGGSGYSYGAGSRVLLMMDDLPVLVPDSGFPNWDDLPLENIGQIEIVKGAASALYGSSAMNGIIHFRSSYPGSEPYSSVSISSKVYLKPSSGKEWWNKGKNVGIPHESFINFVHREKIDRFDYSLSGQYYNRIGYNKEDNSKIGRLHALLRKRLNDRLKISLGINYNQGNSSDFFYWKDNGLFEGDSSSTSTTRKLRFTIDPSITYDSKSGFRHKLLTRYYYVENNNANNQSNRSNNVYAEYQLSKTIESIDLQCIGGLVLNQSWTKAALYSDTSFYHRNIAGFIQLEKRFFDRLILSAGFRYEDYDIHGPHSAGGKEINSRVSQDTTIYRLGANYRLAKASFLRASFGQGFRFPTIAEKYISTYAGGISIVPNPDLHAEYGASYEIGFKQAIQISATKLLIDLALFNSRYHDMMEFMLNSFAQFQSINIGDTEIKGFEIDVQSKTEIGKCLITSEGGYTYIEPQYLEFDKTPITNLDLASRGQLNAATSSSEINILKYRSKHLFRYDIQMDYGKFYLGLNFNYTSNVEAIDKIFDFLIKGERDYRLAHIEGSTLFDFRIGYQLRQLNLQLNLNNAFNEDYTQRPGLMAAPRNLAIRLTYKL